jgi:hypothetical protein
MSSLLQIAKRSCGAASCLESTFILLQIRVRDVFSEEIINQEHAELVFSKTFLVVPNRLENRGLCLSTPPPHIKMNNQEGSNIGSNLQTHLLQERFLKLNKEVNLSLFDGPEQTRCNIHVHVNDSLLLSHHGDIQHKSFQGISGNNVKSTNKQTNKQKDFHEGKTKKQGKEARTGSFHLGCLPF